MTFGWDYPPGVTGNEPQLASYPPCAKCGHDFQEHDPDQQLVCLVSACRCRDFTDDPHWDEDEDSRGDWRER